ncbi:MAG: hypothetical protein NTW49_06185, partial [Bacteroidia bacterium]|nr:hypothetical protein [Bacteroidia bacterium]
MKYINILLLATGLSGQVYSQVPTVQDCLGAIPICQNIYSTVNSYTGVGNYSEIGYFGSTCLDGENNSVWYIFTAETSGFLVFSITPNNMADDYDWGVWDITNASCADIQNNTINPLSCNSWGSLSGYNGPTGASTAMGGVGNSNGPGDTNGPEWNQDIPVLAGGTYVMMIDNWTASQYGYTINFSNSTATIFDDVSPWIDSITSTITCGTTSITFQFSEKVLCSTVQSTDFTLTGPGGPYTISSVSGNACTLGGNQEKVFTIVFSPAISTNGSYSLNLVDTVTDLCGNVAPNGILDFQVTSIPPAPTLTSNSPVCTNGTLSLTAFALAGATYHWTGPVGYSSSVQNPTLSSFTQANAGTYTCIATANGCVSSPSTVQVAFQPSTVYVNLGPDTTLCSDGTLLLDASNNGGNAGATYSWHNSLTGNVATTATYLVDKPATYWVIATDVCGSYSDSITVHYNNLGLDLGVDMLNVCSSTPVTINATTPLGGYPSVTYHWSTGAITPTITVTANGTYTVSVTRGLCLEVDSKIVTFVSPITLDLGPDQFVCTGSTDTVYAGNYPGSTYLWSTGQITQSMVVSNPGTYSLTVTNSCGSYHDNINISQINIPVVHIGNDTTICNGQVVILDATTPDGTYHWSNGSVSPGLAVNTGGTYGVTVTNQCGSASDEVIITADHPLIVDFGNDTTVCPGYLLSYPCTDCSYFWSTGATTSSIAVTQNDGYSVDVTNACGTYSDLINLQVIQLNVNLGPDTIICPGSELLLNASNPGQSYLWSDGTSSQTLQVINAGTYSVSVTNQCQTKSDTIVVMVFDPAINLGNDTSICNGSSLTLDAGHPGSSYHWSTGENTQTISITAAGDYSVTVTNYCGTISDNRIISLLPSPVVNLGADTFLIDAGQSITLDAGVGGIAYHWSTGATSQSITVSNQ